MCLFPSWDTRGRQATRATSHISGTQVWTSVGACLFAASTLVNAGLAMVLLVNLRPGFRSYTESPRDEEYPYYGTEHPTLRSVLALHVFRRHTKVA